MRPGGNFPDLLSGDMDLAGFPFFLWGYHTRLDVSWNPLCLAWAALKKLLWEATPSERLI